MKKTYQQPTVKILSMRQSCPLLSDSGDTDGLKGEISGYDKDSGSGFSQDDDDDDEYVNPQGNSVWEY